MNYKNEARVPEYLPDQTDISFSSRSSLLLFASVMALFAARLWHLTASCLWFDEIFSVHAAWHAWPDLVRFVAADIIHPPLFYALLKVWISIGGDSLLWLRLFPALISIAAIIPFFFLCRELRLDADEVNLALLLIAVNGYLIKYAQELRMYSLLLFLALCSLWLFARFFNARAASKKELFALFTVNLLLVYTHYSGRILVGLQVVALLLWRRSRPRWFLAAMAVLVLAYIPWVYEVTNVIRTTKASKGLGQNIGWVTRPHLLDVAQYFTLLNKPFLFRQSTAEVIYDPLGTFLAIILVGFPLLAFSWHFFRPTLNEARGRVEAGRSLFLFAFAPILIVFGLSWVFPYSIWGTRHLIITAGPYSILAALSLRRLRPYWTRITVYLMLGCWFLLAGTLSLFMRPPTFIWCAWEQLSQEMMVVESNSTEAVQVYAFEDLVAYHLWFTLDTTNSSRFKITVVKGLPGIFDDPAYFLPRNFSDIAVQDTPALKGDHIWIAFRTKQWNETGPPLNHAERAGYHLGRVLATTAQGQEAFLVEFRRN